MADVELEQKESLTRQEVAQRLSALAKALAQGGDVEIQLGPSTVKLHVPDEVRTEFEVEVDGDEIELELELKWSTAGKDGASPTR
jgi:amphi-Trp domain-containing protein